MVTAASPETIEISANRPEQVLRDARREQDLYLAVHFGQYPANQIVHARLRNGRMFVTAGELRGIGLAIPDAGASSWIALDSLAGLGYRYDIPSQSLILDVPPRLRRGQHLGYESPRPVEVQRQHGVLWNYDLYLRNQEDQHNDDQNTASLGTALNWFGRLGSLRVSGVSRAGEVEDDFRRLDSFWTYSDPNRLWTWTAGDLASGGHSWNRPVRMAGLQWRRNFGLRPDLITLPIPSFDGSAALPSTVELYINDRRQFGQEVEPGPFVLDTLPRMSGAGMASLVVTDALGRQVETSVPLYVDHRRLARGLSDFSVELGLLRHYYSGLDDEYGDDPVSSASLLYGVTDTFTVESHLEAASHLGMAGLGGVWSPAGRWGLISASLAYSDGRADNESMDATGYQHSLGYQWFGSRFGFDLLSLRRDREFRDLADFNGGVTGPVRRLKARDRISLWMRAGRGSLGYSYLRYRDYQQQSTLDNDSFDRHSVSITRNIGRRLSISVTLAEDSDQGTVGSFNASFSLAPRLHTSLGVTRDGDGDTRTQALVRRSAPYDGGWGGWLRAGDDDYAQAAVEVRGRYGEARVGVDHRDDRAGYFAEANGSIVAMDNGVFASRRIHDAFALVHTGVADIPVLSENREYGHTDRNGYLLIPALRGWERNRLAIDPDQLGLGYAVDTLEQFVVPPDRAGQLVDFTVQRLRPALITLLDPGQNPLAAGATAVVHPGTDSTGEGNPVPVGFGGEIYLEDISEGARIVVRTERRLCRYRLDPDKGEGESSALGRVQLMPENCGERQ